MLGRARPTSMKVVAVDAPVPVASTFGKLTIDETSSSESGDDEQDEQETSNGMLKQLAKEREERMQQREQQQRAQQQQPVASKNKKKKKQKKKKKKLDDDENLDDLDDMAFLDAQIDKQQSSHGRKIEANGKGYRSIINGVLSSTPQSRSEETKAIRKNTAATSSLQAKIKSSATSRKVKPKKKK